MRIVFVGNFRVPFTTENDLAWSYEKLGHKVIRMQEDYVTTQEVLQQASNADMLHYVHTHGWETRGFMTMDEVLKKLERRGIPTVSTHLDTWYGLRRASDVANHPFWKTQYVFTADGGADEWIKSLGIPHYYLKAGVVERDCELGDYDEKFAFDVIFVGSKQYHPEWPYRPQLINWLEKTYGSRFAHFGGDGRGVVRGKQLNDLYASAKVVVGDTLCLNFDRQEYWSDRIYETTGRGGFMIHPFIEGLQNDFEFDKEIIVYQYGNFDELKAKIDYYLADDKKRKAIQLAGHERTKRDHTYTNRMQQVIETVFGGNK